MSNPIMKLEERRAEQERVVNADEIMTVNGTLQLTAFMGVLLVLAAGVVWSKFAAGYTDLAMMLTPHYIEKKLIFKLKLPKINQIFFFFFSSK